MEQKPAGLIGVIVVIQIIKQVPVSFSRCRQQTGHFRKLVLTFRQISKWIPLHFDHRLFRCWWAAQSPMASHFFLVTKGWGKIISWRSCNQINRPTGLAHCLLLKIPHFSNIPGCALDFPKRVKILIYTLWLKTIENQHASVCLNSPVCWCEVVLLYVWDIHLRWRFLLKRMITRLGCALLL